MTKATATKTKKSTAALESKSLEAYGKGCGVGHQLAMKWLSDRQRTLPSIYSDGLQHVMLDFMSATQKSRSTIKKWFIRGQVVGFFYTLESPSDAAQLEIWRLKQDGES